MNNFSSCGLLPILEEFPSFAEGFLFALSLKPKFENTEEHFSLLMLFLEFEIVTDRANVQFKIYLVDSKALFCKNSLVKSWRSFVLNHKLVNE